MSWTDRFNNPGYKNWLRMGIALQVTRDGLKNVTLQAANKLHADLKAKLGDSVENCTCNPTKGNCKDCAPWRQELETYYTGDVQRIGWSNCTPSKWSKEPWEVAKVFMPKGKTADNTGPEKSDASALLNFLVHCTYCKQFVSVNPAEKVIEVRNETMHSKDLTFGRQTFNEYMDKMDRLLRLVKDPLTLAADITAKKAADEILKIKKGEFHIGDNKACLDAEICVFREFMGEQEKLLQLHKEQLEDHGTRLDTLERSIPPVKEVLQTVGPILDIVNNNPDLQRFLKDQAMELSTIAQQLQDRLDKVEGAVSQLEETVAEHGEQISDVQQKLHQLKLPSGSTMVSPDEQTSAFTRALTIKYSNTLKTLKPLPWDDRFCLDLDKIFTRLVLVGRQGREARRVFESLDDVFNHQPESGQSKRFNVLVVGDAGSGKSTLLSKTALDWASKKGRLADMNKIVLLIRLREVEPGESIAEIVWDQCVTKSAKGISSSSIETCLQDYESDVVFLLDGYDELVPDAKEPKQAVPELLAKTWYPDCTVIVTSRPSSGIERYMGVDCKVKVMGFSSSHINEYVPLYFQCVERPYLADPLVKALDSKANIVARGLIQTPMFLMLICVLWEENPTIVQFPVTMTGLYQALLTCVIRKYCVREGLPMSNGEIPPVVSAALLQLGKLALEALLRGESLVDIGKKTANQDTDVMVNLGIVSKEVSASRLHPRQQLNFPHKSMQEFLAARYAADRVDNSSDDLHSLVPLDTMSAVLQQENLAQFICGCGGKAAGELLSSLNRLYVADDDDSNKTLKYLCLMSLYEGNDSQHFPILSTVLSSLDVFITIPCREGAALKYYLDHATAVPEGRSLKLTLLEERDGDAVEYLSCLVEKTSDVRLYLICSYPEYYEYDGYDQASWAKCYIGDKFGKLIPFFTNVPNMYSLDLTRTCLTPESVQALGQILPKLTMLEKLDLSHNSIGDKGLEPLAAIQQPVASPKVLRLSSNQIGDVCLRSLAAVLHRLSCLEILDLSYNNIGDERKEPFAAIQQPVASLKGLDLSHNKVGDVCLGSLAAVLHHLSCLEKLDLSCNNIGDDGMEPFASIQQPVASPKVLILSYNKIGDFCVGSLAAVLHNLSCLEELDLSCNNIGHDGLEPFASIQQPIASLKVLHLSWNKIGDVCLRSLAAVLHHLSCLEELDLSCNNIGNDGLELFAAIQQPVASLKVLNPISNVIGDVCLRSLAAVLHHLSCLEELDLSNNNIGDEGLEPFAAIQQPVSLKVLNLSCNKIGDVCLGSLVAVLHHLSCLEELNLRHNNIGDEGLEPFAAIQQPVVCLKVLDLSRNKIGDVCLGSLAAVLHHLSCLEELDLSQNNIGNDGLKPFAAIQQPVVSLKVLNLSHNKIGDVCLGSLAAVLHHLSCLERLDLSQNMIGNEELEPFAAIQQPVVSLKVLNLTSNKIGDVCLGSLVAVLHHLSCLTHLILSQNNIGDAEVESLAATLHHVLLLEYVSLDDNPVTAVGLQSFAETIPKMPALERLYLSPQQTVHLDDTAAMSICTMLTRLPVLRRLDLRNISMQATGFQAVDTAAEEHTTLQELLYYTECVPQGVNKRSSKITLCD